MIATPATSRAFYGALYDVLVAYADADHARRDDFIAYLCRESGSHEWRFMGSLGMGGKLFKSCGRIWVSCYSEDETPKRRATIARVNREIEALVRERDGVKAGPV